MKMKSGQWWICLCVPVLAVAVPMPAETESFYKAPSIFSSRANETASLQTIERFGPVGMAIDLVQPAFVMQVGSIEDGSPAAATGKLKAGQIIDSINGDELKDVDPRFQLADMIGKAEATDGVLRFMIKETPESEAEEIVVKIPVLGAYSDTWPLNCKKSDKIVRDFADYLATTEWNGESELNGPALLFLISTGEKQDLAVAKEWVKKTVEFYETNPAPFKNWRIGWGGVPLAEYYLRTGDESILPVIQKYADLAKDHHYLGGWAHGGTGLFSYMGGGHMNAAGGHVLAFLLLAKECGVDVDEKTLQSSLQQFYRFSGRGLSPYGDGRPENGFVDNGRCANLAIAMAAAASLTPAGEESLYARASEAAALKSFYTTPWMNHGHTGGGIGEIWRSFAMGMLHEKRPIQYRSFMDTRKWFYELSRRYDGSFGILGGGRYDGRRGTTPTWGYAMGLSYTAPRKTLRITGAPRTEYCREYQLPKRPWGNAADDVFLSLKACVDGSGRVADVEKETLAEDAAMFMLANIGRPDVSEETVRRYAHHQEKAIRDLAAMRAAGMIPKYMFQEKAEKALFPGLVTELLQSEDPRVRFTGLHAVSQLPDELLTDGNVELIAGMINDPEESWFVADKAMLTIALGKPELIAPHIDRLLCFLGHDEWWLRNSALSALMPVIADERHYAKIFPVLSRVIGENQRYNTLAPLRGLAGELKDAEPKVQKAAVEMLGNAYVSFSPEKQTREVPNLGGETRHLDLIASYLAACPGGLDELLKVAQKRSPNEILPHRNEYLTRMGRDAVSVNVQKAVRPIILEELIPQHVAKNYQALVKLAASESASGYPGGRNEPMDQLVGLLRKAGIDGYEWHVFGPDLREAEWLYHTFDPIPSEQKPWDQLRVRARRVTMPEGMQDWYKVEFDAEKAGWKKGRSAFGQFNGKIPDHSDSRCVGPHSGCQCGTKVNALWDKEILMFRGTCKLPEMKEGYRYRLRINEGDHVGVGGGAEVYINGKKIGSTGCPRRGQGGLPKGAFITSKWMKELSGQEATIAVKAFIRYNRSFQHKPSKREPQGVMSVHFEEMKLPPFSHDQVLKAATLVPMLTAEWQAKEFEGLNDEGGDDKLAEAESAADGKFRYDGTFIPNSAVVGSWRVLGKVQEIEDFTPGTELEKGRPPFTTVTINEDGTTDNPTILWTGERMMNLNKFEALRMVPKTIDDTAYLFVEEGSFHVATGIPVGWKSPWCVLTRK